MLFCKDSCCGLSRPGIPGLCRLCMGHRSQRRSRFRSGSHRHKRAQTFSVEAFRIGTLFTHPLELPQLSSSRRCRRSKWSILEKRRIQFPQPRPFHNPALLARSCSPQDMMNRDNHLGKPCSLREWLCMQYSSRESWKQPRNVRKPRDSCVHPPKQQWCDFMASPSRCLMKTWSRIVMRCAKIHHPFIDLI